MADITKSVKALLSGDDKDSLELKREYDQIFADFGMPTLSISPVNIDPTDTGVLDIPAPPFRFDYYSSDPEMSAIAHRLYDDETHLKHGMESHYHVKPIGWGITPRDRQLEFCTGVRLDDGTLTDNPETVGYKQGRPIHYCLGFTLYKKLDKVIMKGDQAIDTITIGSCFLVYSSKKATLNGFRYIHKLCSGNFSNLQPVFGDRKAGKKVYTTIVKWQLRDDPEGRVYAGRPHNLLNPGSE